MTKTVRVRIYGRRSASAALVVHLHGGAFVSGTLENGSAVSRLLADAGAVVMSIDYPLAPDHPFPEAVETVYAALEWGYLHRAKLAGQGAAVIVAGEEAGGNLAAAVSLMARDRQHPPLAGQILLSPMLDSCVATASLRDADAGPVGCKWADGWHQYLPRVSDASHPYAAPGSCMRLAGLPFTLLVTAHDDPMRDEVQAYAQRLRDAGVRVDEAVLPDVTGWPCTYMKPASFEAPWAAAVREQLRKFLLDAQARAPGAPTVPNPL